MKVQCLLSLCLMLQVRALSVEPMVRVRTGALRGSKMLSSADREFLAFRGIPYAQAPVGPLRFQVKTSRFLLKLATGFVCVSDMLRLSMRPVTYKCSLEISRVHVVFG